MCDYDAVAVDGNALQPPIIIPSNGAECPTGLLLAIVNPVEGGGYECYLDLTTPGPSLLVGATATFPATFTVPADAVEPGSPAFQITYFGVGTAGSKGGYAYLLSQAPAKSCQSMILWNNGNPQAASLMKLARAILVPPRQNLLVTAQAVSYADNPQNPVATQGSRNVLSLTSNLNQADLINKCVTMTLDGLLSRDVQ